jgi:tRNA pseudouridine13 synthase
MQAWEISPTGPMFGAKMRLPESDALVSEERVLERAGLSHATFAKHTKLGEGTRRSSRVRPVGWEVCAEEDAVMLRFELPPGSYATSLLREVMKPV